MPETIEITSVPPDIDAQEVATVKNPFNNGVKVKFAGKPITIEAGKQKDLPLPAAAHVAKHLAEYKVRSTHRAKTRLIKDNEKRKEHEEKGIPNYQGKIWEEMKKILTVQEGSSFFKDPSKFRIEAKEDIEKNNTVNLF